MHFLNLSYEERIKSVLFICEYFTWYVCAYAPVVRRNIILDSACKITERGSETRIMSDDENLGDKTQRYESGAVTDDNSELKNVLAEILSRVFKLGRSH